MKKMISPLFPNSKKEPFNLTSPTTTSYNCIAWAFGDNNKWYWPDPLNTYYWPDNISREINIKTFIELFASIGYEVCKSGKFEEGFEKVAVFVDSEGLPTHAARQLPNGFWTSKLGPNVDVQHTITSMEGGVYGIVRTYMKRKNS